MSAAKLYAALLEKAEHDKACGMKPRSTLRIPLGRTTELVQLIRRSADALLVQRPAGTRIWINDTQILSIQQHQEKAR